jgi:mRNA interferase RelE/StbE
MGEYTVEIVSKAEREFLKLPVRVRTSLAKKMLSLEDNPRPLGAKKLKETDYYRIRVGDFRVIYSIDDARRIVRLLSVAHGREVYR